MQVIHCGYPYTVYEDSQWITVPCMQVVLPPSLLERLLRTSVNLQVTPL
jgi:hypothetical protein